MLIFSEITSEISAEHYLVDTSTFTCYLISFKVELICEQLLESSGQPELLHAEKNSNIYSLNLVKTDRKRVAKKPEVFSFFKWD